MAMEGCGKMNPNSDPPFHSDSDRSSAIEFWFMATGAVLIILWAIATRGM